MKYESLLEFCSNMDGGSLDDVVAATIATSLFWGLGRTSELLHAPSHPPLKVDALKLSPYGFYQFQLVRPKRGRINYASQFISPVRRAGRTRTQSWIILLLQFRKSGECLFDLANGKRARNISMVSSKIRREYDSTIHKSRGM